MADKMLEKNMLNVKYLKKKKGIIRLKDYEKKIYEVNISINKKFPIFIKKKSYNIINKNKNIIQLDKNIPIFRKKKKIKFFQVKRFKKQYNKHQFQKGNHQCGIYSICLKKILIIFHFIK